MTFPKFVKLGGSRGSTNFEKVGASTADLKSLHGRLGLFFRDFRSIKRY